LLPVTIGRNWANLEAFSEKAAFSGCESAQRTVGVAGCFVGMDLAHVRKAFAQYFAAKLAKWVQKFEVTLPYLDEILAT